MDFDSDNENYAEDLWLKINNNILREQVKQLQESRARSDEAFVHRVTALELRVQGTLIWVIFFHDCLHCIFSQFSPSG